MTVTDNSQTLVNALAEIKRLEGEIQRQRERHRKTWRQLEQVTGLLREIIGALRSDRDLGLWQCRMNEADRWEREAAALSQQAEPVEQASAQDEREAFEECWAVRNADDEGNIGNKPLRSLVDQQRYRGDAVNGSWVWFQRGAAWQRTRPAQTEQQVPERLPVEPYQTVDRSSTNYKAGWNACRKAMLEGQTAPQPEQSGLPLEPTEAMLDAYWEHTGESVEMRDRVHDRARKLYAAMARAALSSTPSPAMDAKEV